MSKFIERVSTGLTPCYKLVVAGGGNKQHAGPTGSLAKLEQETEQFKGVPTICGWILIFLVNTVDKNVAKAIASGRQQKNLTQKDLATVRLY